MQRGFQGHPGQNTVWPKVIDDVLYNPGMGFTTMRAFEGDVPGYPRSTITYWRWYWEEFIFNEALRWHCSIFNNKSSPIPPRWWGATERFLKRMGYRLVLRHLTHPLKVRAGESLKIDSEWENAGVAPPYRGYVIAFELRPLPRRTTEGAVRFTSGVDVRAWLPGRHEVSSEHKTPPDLKPGRYLLALALLDPHTGRPAVQLAVEGRDSQGWYCLSEIEIQEDAGGHDGGASKV